MSEDPTPPSSTEQGGQDAASVPPHPLATAVGLSVAVSLVVLDQATKQLVEALLTPGRFVPWIGEHVGWQLIYNPGGAFGLPLPHWVFLLVTAGVLVLVARILPRSATLLAATAYGMLLAGAVGNVLDRLFRPGGEVFGSGYVVDFVAWGSFPRFNVADSAITVGFVLLVLALWREERMAEVAGAAVGEIGGGTAAGAGEVEVEAGVDTAEVEAEDTDSGEPADRGEPADPEDPADPGDPQEPTP